MILCLTLWTSFYLCADPVNTNWRGVAVKGYDVVAYFRQSAAVKGDDNFSVAHQGITYYFVSQENKNLFVAEPAKYLPQYGGYCAWAVSQGSKADIDPEAWKIVDGRLFLNYSLKIQKKWEENMSDNIHLADKNWPELSGK